MSRIAWFCIPAWGHTNPTVEVVRVLTARGHQVRYYTFAPFREKLEAAGAEVRLCDKFMPPPPPDTPTRQDWNDLLVALTALYRLERSNSDRLDHLEASVGAQEALLRALSQQVGQLPTREQTEALARDVAQMRAELKQAGKKKELSISPPSLRTALSVLIWLALILLATMVGMVVLQTIWSGLAALWKVVQMLIP